MRTTSGSLPSAEEPRSAATAETEQASEPPPAADDEPPAPFSTARSLLRHAGTWAGDDFEECLEAVYASRGQARF